MDSEPDILLPALKFLTSATEHICRLCFSPTDDEEVDLDDSMKLQRPYMDETVTFSDMFNELSVSSELSLPQVLCLNCATMTINSYLFKKLCHYSNKQWSTTLRKLSTSLDLTENVGDSVQTVFLMMKDEGNIMLTSRKRNSHNMSKKAAVAKIKRLMQVKPSYEKVKRIKSTVICEECGEKFKSNCHLVKHMKVHSNSRHPCPQCPKIFASKLQLDEHAERVHYPKKLQCPKCCKMFSTEKMLKYHDKLHHVAAICKLCFIQFPSKKDLRAHLDKHDVNKCPRCNKSFLNKHTFKFHIKICGNIEERQPSFFCDICNKGYARKNGLRTHLKTDHGFGNVLTCNWCDKKFDAISRLRNHQVKHTKERNFHCDQCGGKFVTQAALIYHVRLHTGERPFPCDLCNESFLSASRRMAHKRRKHFGPTKECHICHVKFVTGHQLRKHVQRHYNPRSKLFTPEVEEPYLNINLSANNYMKEQQFSSISKLLSM